MAAAEGPGDLCEPISLGGALLVAGRHSGPPSRRYSYDNWQTVNTFLSHSFYFRAAHVLGNRLTNEVMVVVGNITIMVEVLVVVIVVVLVVVVEDGFVR